MVPSTRGLIKLIRIFATLQRNLALVNQYRGTDPDRFLQQHRDLIEAIQRKDTEMAMRVMEWHFADVLDSLSQEKAQT